MSGDEAGLEGNRCTDSWDGNADASYDASEYKNYSTADVNSLGIPNP